jgi:hypothetical protein
MNSENNANARWYVLIDKGTGARSLVEANNRAQAFRRFGEHYAIARPASVKETVEIMREGGDVVSAPQGPEQLDLEEATTAEPLGDGPLAPDLPKVTDIVPEARKAPEPSATQTETGKLIRRTTRRAAEVFGAGFGPKDEPDVG